jgi:hypothetical protein
MNGNSAGTPIYDFFVPVAAAFRSSVTDFSVRLSAQVLPKPDWKLRLGNALVFELCDGRIRIVLPALQAR